MKKRKEGESAMSIIRSVLITMSRITRKRRYKIHETSARKERKRLLGTGKKR